MSHAVRAKILAIGFAVVAMLGCGDTKSTFTSTATISGAPTKPSGDGYSKKLVGVWEGKENLGDKEFKVTIEFTTDGSLKVQMDELAMKGTYKVVKEEGKTVTIDTEMAFEGAPAQKKKMTAIFEDADNITMSPTDMPDPKKLKRKS